jgi:hypothetical protein
MDYEYLFLCLFPALTRLVSAFSLEIFFYLID